ncbi:unnamed protein product [Didymodactylos carnosus]|nr:unnamed protein product [Didymodactylos carnosus]CAF3810940.1 unnamed protein product [Didymodactylos carnosus]
MVMCAASFWSLLDPGIRNAKESKLYGQQGQYAFIPITIGFIFGSLFVYISDLWLPSFENLNESFFSTDKKHDNDIASNNVISQYRIISMNYEARQRVSKNVVANGHIIKPQMIHCGPEEGETNRIKWNRMLLLIIAVTVHNFPEGMAVGVGFGSVKSSLNETNAFNNARNLAFGIGLQNFPEGLAISIPLRSYGMTPWKSFW